ncbi:MAG TPA: cupredoxin domain-containing protein [Egibacteraceae bacterium]|jgi:plastocyanin|nr:cupredoxin domain-containing protein [Egibacteraceae bacterium]
MTGKTFTLLMAASLALAGCMTDDELASPPVPEQSPSGEAVVVVADFAFAPEEIAVAPGSAVEWTFDEGRSRHTVTFDDGEKSGDLEPGDTYTRVFDEAGTYPYFCFFHPRMTGTVTVTG